MVFPINKNEKPYSTVVRIKSGENNLKNLFQEDYFYWKQYFKGHSPIEPPNYSVFRKEIPEKMSKPIPNPLAIHILLLKCENHKFPRNLNARELELHCNTKFYGQMIVAFNSS